MKKMTSSSSQAAPTLANSLQGLGGSERCSNEALKFSGPSPEVTPKTLHKGLRPQVLP